MRRIIKSALGPDRVRWLARYLIGVEMVSLSTSGRLPIHRLRVAALRAWGATISSEAVLYHGVEVRGAKNLIIGARANIGDGATLDARGGLEIGSDTNLSTRVEIWTAQHDRNSPEFAYEDAPVVIGSRVWIGPRAVILPGSVVGDGAIVAAGAVVKGVVEPYTMVGGVPARLIAKRSRDLRYHLATPKEKTPWW